MPGRFIPYQDQVALVFAADGEMKMFRNLCSG